MPHCFSKRGYKVEDLRTSSRSKKRQYGTASCKHPELWRYTIQCVGYAYEAEARSMNVAKLTERRDADCSKVAEWWCGVRALSLRSTDWRLFQPCSHISRLWVIEQNNDRFETYWFSSPHLYSLSPSRNDFVKHEKHRRIHDFGSRGLLPEQERLPGTHHTKVEFRSKNKKSPESIFPVRVGVNFVII